MLERNPLRAKCGGSIGIDVVNAMIGLPVLSERVEDIQLEVNMCALLLMSAWTVLLVMASHTDHTCNTAMLCCTQWFTNFDRIIMFGHCTIQ